MALQSLVNRLRQFRTWHHWVGISVALFMLITSTTGVLLGWKKNVPAGCFQEIKLRWPAIIIKKPHSQELQGKSLK